MSVVTSSMSGSSVSGIFKSKCLDLTCNNRCNATYHQIDTKKELSHSFPKRVRICFIFHLSHFTSPRLHNNKSVKGASVTSQSIASMRHSIALLKSDKQFDSLSLQTRSDADEKQKESCRNITLIHTFNDIHSLRTTNKQDEANGKRKSAFTKQHPTIDHLGGNNYV
jgi:hypothetical protein